MRSAVLGLGLHPESYASAERSTRALLMEWNIKGFTPNTMENQMEKKMENEMETGIIG